MNCTECKGEGRVASSFREGEYRSCAYCHGNRSFPDIEAQLPRIIPLLQSRQGGLRTSRPEWPPVGASWDDRVAHERAYYIWRLARFHGGVDMCMPMSASWKSAGDPQRDALDQIAEALARSNFGSDLRGARRWVGLVG